MPTKNNVIAGDLQMNYQLILDIVLEQMYNKWVIDSKRSKFMKKLAKIIVPILLILTVLFSIFWYLLIYDRSFTQDLLLNRARAADSRGNYSTAAWYYDLAYRHSHEDEEVAIELAEQFKSIGNYTKAEYTLSNAISDGGSAKLYIALCKTYVEQDKLRDAVTMLDNIADPAVKAEIDGLRPVAPEASPKDGYYNEYISVTLTADGGKVYATTDGEYPSIRKQPHTGDLKLTGGETVVYALTVSDNGLVSPLRVLGYTIAGVIEEVTIEDPALNSIIREKLSVSDTYTLFTNQLWNITSLDISSDVKDLSELSKMPFIENLTVQQGDYENLSAISALTNLKSLSIDGVTLTTNELKAIASLPDISSLSLIRCNLSSISELSMAKSLSRLDLSNNTIRDLEPISTMAGLEYLNLSHNAVTQLSALTGASKLKELDLSYNSVTSTVALSGCKSLEQLRLDFNTLTNLEGLDKLSELTYLSASHNQLSDISHLAGFTKLTELDLSDNVLTNISALSGISSLKILNFKNNQVTALPSFQKDCALSSIDGSRNSLTSLDALSALSQLNYVYMDYNSSISSVGSLSKCGTLVEVSIYGTAVTDVSALEEMNVIIKYAPV